MHIFFNGGEYEVHLKVTLKSGCHTTIRKTINVSEGPDLQPEYENIHCQGEAIGLYLPGNHFEVTWNFGDPISGSLNEATADSAYHIYLNTNIYTIKVSASDVYKCHSEAIFQIDVKPNTLGGTITLDPASICHGDTATLSSPPGGVHWEWSTGETVPVIEATEMNQYSVVVMDGFNCRYAPPPVFLDVMRQPYAVIKGREVIGPGEYGPWVEELHICHGTEVEIQGFSLGSNSFTWSTGDWNEKISFTSEGGNLLGPGVHDFTFYVNQSVTDCSNEASFIIEVFPLPNKPVIALISGSGCSDDDNVLQVTNPESGITYVWSDGQTGISINTSGSGDYFVTAFDQEGCSIQSDLLTIQPSALGDQIPGGCYLRCDPLTVCLPPLSNVSSYTIFQNGAAITSGTSWPDEFIISNDGSYHIEITSWNGCKAVSDPLNISLYPGVGSITVLTYFDTDGNGLIAPPDVLLPNIPVEIISSDGAHVGETFTNDNGEFVFEDYPSLFYTASFNQDLFSSEWKIIIDSIQGEIKTCDDSIVVALLLQQNCSVQGPTVKFEICPGETIVYGDSTWADVGTYVVHEFNSSGCDSIFEVEITNPDSITINSLVWVDVDRNGVLSASDTLLNNTTIYLENELTSEQFSFTSGTASTFSDGAYTIQMDTLNLSGGLIALYWSDVVADTICGATSFNFLVSPTCAPVFIIQQEFICEG